MTIGPIGIAAATRQKVLRFGFLYTRKMNDVLWLDFMGPLAIRGVVDIGISVGNKIGSLIRRFPRAGHGIC